MTMAPTPEEMNCVVCTKAFPACFSTENGQLGVKLVCDGCRGGWEELRRENLQCEVCNARERAKEGFEACGVCSERLGDFVRKMRGGV